jgi:hypothetical protein
MPSRASEVIKRYRTVYLWLIKWVFVLQMYTCVLDHLCTPFPSPKMSHLHIYTWAGGGQQQHTDTLDDTYRQVYAEVDGALSNAHMFAVPLFCVESRRDVITPQREHMIEYCEQVIIALL